MVIEGIATGPASSRYVETKKDGSKEVLELRLLEDTLGDAVTLQLWEPKPDITRRLLDVVRGTRVIATVKSLSVYGDRVRLVPDVDTLQLQLD